MAQTRRNPKIVSFIIDGHPAICFSDFIIARTFAYSRHLCDFTFHWVIYRTHLAKKQPARISPQADYLYLRFVIELLDLIMRLAGQVYAELAVDIRVNLGEYN